jgi:microcin C transport system ATP-binding protein
VSITVRAGQTLGVVGESGSGKTTLGLALIAADQQRRPDPSSWATGCTAAPRKQMRPLRREMQVVFQDPYGSLSPRMSIRQIVEEGLLIQQPGTDL